MKKQTLLLGAHISIAGGYDKAIERAASIGCTTLQIFTKSNRQWAAKPITLAEAELFKKAVKESQIHHIVVHASYLINLASAHKEVQLKSTAALVQELERCHQLGIPYLVLHPGSNGEAEKSEALAFIAENITTALENIDSANKTMILLETMAGQGSTLCSTFEEIATIRSLVNKKNSIGICVDTCHIFAAGYDLRTEKAYTQTWDLFDSLIGLEHIKVIHCNDSKKECGSRVDRHEMIGKGKLHDKSFELLFNDPRFFNVPKILETPKTDISEDLINMQHIVRLLTKETRELLEISVK